MNDFARVRYTMLPYDAIQNNSAEMAFSLPMPKFADELIRNGLLTNDDKKDIMNEGTVLNVLEMLKKLPWCKTVTMGHFCKSSPFELFVRDSRQFARHFTKHWHQSG